MNIGAGRPSLTGQNQAFLESSGVEHVARGHMWTSPVTTVATHEPQRPSRHEWGTAIPAASNVSTSV